MNRDKALDQIVRTLTEERHTVDNDFIRETFMALYGTDVRIEDESPWEPLSHEQAVMIAMMDWTPDDNAYALNEGWGIFDSDSRGLEIERDAEDAGIISPEEMRRAYTAIQQYTQRLAPDVNVLRLVLMRVGIDYGGYDMWVGGAGRPG